MYSRSPSASVFCLFKSTKGFLDTIKLPHSLCARRHFLLPTSTYRFSERVYAVDCTALGLASDSLPASALSPILSSPHPCLD